jgi:hypothetical protein
MKKFALILLIVCCTSCVENQQRIANETCADNKLRADRVYHQILDQALVGRKVLAGIGGAIVCTITIASLMGTDGGSLCTATATVMSQLPGNTTADFEMAQSARKAVLRSDCR